MRILQIAPRLCWPLDTGAKLRNYHLARVLANKAEVSLLAFADDEATLDLKKVYADVVTVPHEGRYSASKIVRGAVGNTPLPILNYTSEKMNVALARLLGEKKFDVIQFESIHVFNSLPIIRAVRNAPIAVCDWHNIESNLMAQYGSSQRNPLRKAYADRTTRLMKQFEKRALTEFDAHVCVSDRDAEHLRTLNPTASIFVIENGVDVAYYSSADNSKPTRNRILFVGSMDYHANIDAVIHFAREVWPQVHERKPHLVFTIVGKDPVAEVRSLASISGVEVTGTVADVRPFYREAIASIVPLRVGGGSRLKILESMAAGVPVISTTLGAEGLDVSDDKNIVIAEDRATFVEAIERIVRDNELRGRIIMGGRGLVTQRYDWSKLGAALFDVYDKLIARGFVTAD